MQDIIQKIISVTGLSEEDVNRKIEEKQMELGGLVSKEGSAYVLAKELGLDLVRRTRQKINIAKITAGLSNLNFDARVIRKFDVRKFVREGKEGKVVNIILGDSTGTIRMSLWNEQIDILNSIDVGTAVEVFGAYTKEDNRGEPEIRIGMRGGLKILENSDLPTIEELEKTRTEPIRSWIAGIKEGQIYEIRASLVQLFETEIFYEICPQCGARIRKENGIYNCKEHGEIEPEWTIAVSGIIDDGTENIRVILFRELGAKLLGMEMQDVLNKRGKLFEGIDILGKEFIFVGRARRNKIFNRLEFIVSDLKEVDIKKEINLLINSFDNKNK